MLLNTASDQRLFVLVQGVPLHNRPMQLVRNAF